MLKPRAVVLVGVTLVCATSGCVDGERTAAPSPSTHTTAAVPSTPPITGAPTAGASIAVVRALPIDEYMFSAEELLIVTKATNRVIASCMESLGFPYDIPEYDAPIEHRYSRRYGLLDVASANTLGYHPPHLVQPTPDEKSDSYNEALLGHDPSLNGGCLNNARDILMNGNPYVGTSLLADRLENESWLESTTDARVVAAFDAWSECMTAHGFDYPNPMAAWNDPSFDTPEATLGEKTAAVAEVECKQQTNLVATWQAVESDIQRRLIAENLPSLTKDKIAILGTVTRAHSVLADSE